jgi:hypothetical protein
MRIVGYHAVKGPGGSTLQLDARAIKRTHETRMRDARSCQSEEMLNCLTFYLDGGMYTSLYPLDARHPDPPQSPLGSGILIGQSPNRAIGC